MVPYFRSLWLFVETTQHNTLPGRKAEDRNYHCTCAERNRKLVYILFEYLQFASVKYPGTMRLFLHLIQYPRPLFEVIFVIESPIKSAHM